MESQGFALRTDRRMASIRSTVRRLFPAAEPNCCFARQGRREYGTGSGGGARHARSAGFDRLTTAAERRQRRCDTGRGSGIGIVARGRSRCRRRCRCGAGTAWREPRRIDCVDRLSRTERGAARLRDREAHAAIGEATQTATTAPRGRRRPRPPARFAGDDSQQRQLRRYADAARLEAAPARSSAIDSARGRQPLDESLQLFLYAARESPVLRTRGCPLFHISYAHDRCRCCAERSRPLAVAGTAASGRDGLGRRHAHRRVPAGFRSRPWRSLGSFAHRRDHRQ